MAIAYYRYGGSVSMQYLNCCMAMIYYYDPKMTTTMQIKHYKPAVVEAETAK